MYQIEELLEHGQVIHGFSTKSDGNASFLWDKVGSALTNRKLFLNKLGLELENCACIRVRNGNDIAIVGTSDKGRGMLSVEDAIEVDAAVTNEKGVNLFLPVADCLPIIVFDPVRNVIGIIHGAWQTTDKLLAAKTISVFKEKFGSNPVDILVFFGPGITKQSHVFDDVIQKEMPAWQKYLDTRPDRKITVDVIGYNIDQLQGEGVKLENIFQSQIDTVLDSRFFSHYRDSREDPENEDRFACVVGLK